MEQDGMRDPTLPTSLQQARLQVPAQKEQSPSQLRWKRLEVSTASLTRHGRALPRARPSRPAAPASQEMNTRKGCSQEPPKPSVQAGWQGAGERRSQSTAAMGREMRKGEAENTTGQKQGRSLFLERPHWIPPLQQGAVGETCLFHRV